MTPSDFFHTLLRTLQASLSDAEAQTVAFWLLDDVAGLSRSDVLLGRADLLPTGLKARLEQMGGRIAAGEPVQYVLGHTDFCGLRIGVAPGVLIPRPETEDVVESCYGFSPRRIYDLCTGSGCMALALKHRFPAAQVEGWDLSEQALQTACENAERLQLDVTFRRVDVLNIPDGPKGEENRETSLLVSNPPYVCESERGSMQAVVLDHEPAEALFVPDDDALRYYRAIARWGRVLLRDGDPIVVEVNRRFATDVARLLESEGYAETRVLDDRYGNQRTVQARRCCAVD